MIRVRVRFPFGEYTIGGLGWKGPDPEMIKKLREVPDPKLSLGLGLFNVMAVGAARYYDGEIVGIEPDPDAAEAILSMSEVHRSPTPG